MNLTRPLQLDRLLTPPDRRLDPVPLLDLALLALCLSWLGSSFIAAPGLTIDLGNDLGLPPVSREASTGLPAIEVMTVKSTEMILFRGQFFALRELEQQAAGVASGGAVNPGDPVLLLKAHRSVDLDALFRLATWARKQGFEKVQLAGDPIDTAPALPKEATSNAWTTAP